MVELRRCRHHVLALAVGAFSVACGPTVTIDDTSTTTDDPVDGSSTTGRPPSVTTMSPTTTTPPQTTSATTAVTTIDSSADADTVGFLDSDFVADGDDGGWEVCTVFDQDCPPGEKCMPWANDGGTSWNATRCSPVSDDPVSVGEACTVEGSGTSGIDNCDETSMCWDVDDATLTGECISFCMGDRTNPVCADPSTQCLVTNDEVLALCVPVCDPILQDCPEGDGCYAFDDSFLCLPTTGEGAGPGTPCEFIATCAPGSTCIQQMLVPDCDAFGCCSSFCDLSGADPDVVCLPGQQCTPLFEDPFFGQRHLGLCALPEE